MRKNSLKFILVSWSLITFLLILSGCSNQNNTEHLNKNDKATAALITDNSGINDNSFNQAAWLGLQAFGSDHKLSQGTTGYQYFKSVSSTNFLPAVQEALDKHYQTIFGSGYYFKKAIKIAAQNNPKKNFVLIDSQIKNEKNVASVTFQSQDAAYLAGITAAYTTKTNIVGFIGGIHSKPTSALEAGFTAGVLAGAKKQHKQIKILSNYINSFNNPDKAQNAASALYNKKADIIFHAAGKSGDGVFSAARTINEAQPVNQKVWVIGVDSNQNQLGNYQAKGGQESNFTLTSVIKGIDVAVNDIANRSYQKDFPGGKHLVYTLKNNGVSIFQSSNIPISTWITVQKIRQKIIAGKIKVPNTTQKALQS